MAVLLVEIFTPSDSTFNSRVTSEFTGRDDYKKVNTARGSDRVQVEEETRCGNDGLVGAPLVSSPRHRINPLQSLTTSSRCP